MHAVYFECKFYSNVNFNDNSWVHVSGELRIVCFPNAVLGIFWGVHCLDDEYTSVKLNWIISEIKVKTSNEIVIKEATDVNSQNKFGPISAGVQDNTSDDNALSQNSSSSMSQGITDDMDSETSEGK